MFFKRNGKLITASTKKQAISKIIASSNRGGHSNRFRVKANSKKYNSQRVIEYINRNLIKDVFDSNDTENMFNNFIDNTHDYNGLELSNYEDKAIVLDVKDKPDISIQAISKVVSDFNKKNKKQITDSDVYAAIESIVSWFFEDLKDLYDRKGLKLITAGRSNGYWGFRNNFRNNFRNMHYESTYFYLKENSPIVIEAVEKVCDKFLQDDDYKGEFEGNNINDSLASIIYDDDEFVETLRENIETKDVIVTNFAPKNIFYELKGLSDKILKEEKDIQDNLYGIVEEYVENM